MSCKHERLVQEAELRCAECNIKAQSVVEALHARVLTAREEGRREGLELALQQWRLSASHADFQGRIRALLDAPEVK